jgi:hypothetical protein
VFTFIRNVQKIAFGSLTVEPCDNIAEKVKKTNFPLTILLYGVNSTNYLISDNVLIFAKYSSRAAHRHILLFRRRQVKVFSDNGLMTECGVRYI